MSEFEVLAKRWPDGATLDLGEDQSSFTILPPGRQDFRRTAAEFVTVGGQQYQFLFWNTGRRLTRKRRVRWEFSLSSWGKWDATKWYGTPPKAGGGLGGVPQIRADAFTIRDNAPLNGTPIDAAASSYEAGDYPLDGNDHVIGTANGGANVVAKDPFPGPSFQGPQRIIVLERPSGPNRFGKIAVCYNTSSYDFAGWLQLVWGGDGTDVFMETDTLQDGSSSFGIYDQVVGGSFSALAGDSADIIAAYGFRTHSICSEYGPGQEWIYEVPGLPVRNLEGLLKQILLDFPVPTKSPSLDPLINILDVPVLPENFKEFGTRVTQELQNAFDRGRPEITVIRMHGKDFID